MMKWLLLFIAAVWALSADVLADDIAEDFLEEVDPKPFSWEVAYTAELWNNDGGVDNGDVYLDKLDLLAEYSINSDWSVFGHVFYSNGDSLNEFTGDVHVVSNIESGIEGLQLSEAWIQGQLSERFNLKVGFYDFNSEFDVLDSSGMFIGSGHGIGLDISQSGENGPSIFPVTGFAVRLETQLQSTLLLRTAFIDAVTGGRSNSNRPALDFSSDEGALLAIEFDYRPGDVKWLVGAWTYTEQQQQWNGTGRSSNSGIYTRAEHIQQLDSGGSLGWFGRLGFAKESINEYSTIGTVGMHYVAANGHELGLAVAHAKVSEDRAEQEVLDNDETVFELTYILPMNDNFSIQPNLQYVISPSADPALNDATVFGLRLVASIGNS